MIARAIQEILPRAPRWGGAGHRLCSPLSCFENCPDLKIKCVCCNLVIAVGEMADALGRGGSEGVTVNKLSLTTKDLCGTATKTEEYEKNNMEIVVINKGLRVMNLPESSRSIEVEIYDLQGKVIFHTRVRRKGKFEKTNRIRLLDNEIRSVISVQIQSNTHTSTNIL